ncbi:hypothetical protein MRBLMR1_004892 [Neorhizobium sp. LMR1-1-1.1]
MNFLGNCDTKISVEHFISDSISHNQPALGAWWEDQKVDDLFPHAVGAKVLCRRHNSEFAHFDEVGKRVFEAITSGPDPTRANVILVSGYDFERFLLQRLCAHHFGGIITIGGSRVSNHKLDTAALVQGFMMNSYEGGGLHLCRPPTYLNGIATQRTFEFAPILSPDGFVLGCRFTMWPVSFALMLRPFINDRDLHIHGRHPFELIVGETAKTASHIIFTWQIPDSSGEIFHFVDM